MKKLFSCILASAMMFTTAGCSQAVSADKQAEDPSSALKEEEKTSVVVTGKNAEGENIDVEVPYQPERVVCLDLASLDILDNLGLEEVIVGVPTITLSYLESYGENLPTVGTVKTPDLEAVMSCEPDLILMGGRMSEHMETLGEIAPVLRLTTDSDAGLVEAIRSNAQTIGTIFGKTQEVNALLDQYDGRIAALSELAAGKNCVLGMSTSGSFNLLGNDGRCSLIVNEIGFDNVGAQAAVSRSSGRGNSENTESEAAAGGEKASGHESSHSHDSSAEGSSEEGSADATPTHGNEVSFESVVSLNPDYIFVMDRDSAIGTNGAQMAQEIMENELIMKTDAYKNGNLIILQNPGIWYLAEGGITSLGMMLEDLENALMA